MEDFLYTRACAVLFASTDSLDSLRAWNSISEADGGLGGVHVPLISDCNHDLSRQYGVLVEDTGNTQRALFIIDPKGILRAIHLNDAYVARNASEILRLLDALIFKDEFGEGCPADWSKGDSGLDIRADRVEGPLIFEPKKSWTEWAQAARPKLTRAFSGTSQRSIASFTAGAVSRNPLIRAVSNDFTGNAINGYDSPLPTSGYHSPVNSPKGGDYSNPTSSSSRMELQMEEAMLRQRMENMNAALQNLKQTETPVVAFTS